jgi:hypothetical protein
MSGRPLEVPDALAEGTVPRESDGLAVTDGPRSPYVTRLAVAVIPAATFLVLGVRAVEPINGQDGYLYVGIVARMQDFLERFPNTYYGMRFGYTLPSLAFERLFGFEYGHLLLRFALLAAVCVAMTAGRALTGTWAVLAAILVSSSPLVVVSTFSTYTLSIGSLTFVLGVLLLAQDGRDGSRDAARVMVATAAFAVAWNCHLVVLLPAVAAWSVAAIDRFRGGDLPVLRATGHRRRTLVLLMVSGVVGTASVVGLGMAILGLRYGITDVYGPALQQADEGASERFRYGGVSWLGYRHYLLVVPAAIVTGVVAWRTEPDGATRTMLRRTTLSTVAVLGVYGWFQWISREPLLEMYFHAGPLLVLSVVTLALAASVILKRLDADRLSLGREGLTPTIPFVLAVTVVLGALAGGARVGGPASIVALGVAGACAVVVSARLLAGGSRTRGIRAVGVTLVLAAASWSAVSSPHDFPPTPGGYRVDPFYDIALFAYDEDSMDRVKILHELSRTLPSLPQDRGQLMMWFDPLGPYDQMSAPFLWYLGRGALQSPADPPPPVVTEAVTTNVVDVRPRFVVVLDDDAQVVTDATAAVVALAPYEIRWRRSFTAVSTSLDVVLLERRAGSWQDFP